MLRSKRYIEKTQRMKVKKDVGLGKIEAQSIELRKSHMP